MKSVTYSGVMFPCSKTAAKLSARQPAKLQHVENCSLDELLQLAQPSDQKGRELWMRRFIADTHWLPLIEVFSGCHPRIDPAAHAAFMHELAVRDVPRIAHRTLGPLDRYFWGSRLRRGLRLRIPDPVAWAAVCGEIGTHWLKKPDVLFVCDDCAAAAEQARPDCLHELPWLLYKAVAVVKGQLDPDGNRVMMLASYGDDPSSEAYWRFIKDGRL